MDQVIVSVKKFAGVLNGSIIVVDDGTPEKYLTELKKRHPEIQIHSSGRNIVSGISDSATKSINLERIMSCWKNTIQNFAGEYFLLLEDDIWLTQRIDLEEVAKVMKMRETVFLNIMKMNRFFEMLEVFPFSQFDFSIMIGRPLFLERCQKSIFFRSLMFFQLSNRKLIRAITKLAKVFGVFPHEQWIRNYQMYGVAGGVYLKSWWLDVWSGDHDRINEHAQMHRALKSYLKSPSQTMGQLVPCAAFTTLRSSSSEKFGDRGIPDFQVSVMNSVLNEVWLHSKCDFFNSNGDLDQNFVIQKFLDSGLDKKFGQDWVTWWSTIQGRYQKIGF